MTTDQWLIAGAVLLTAAALWLLLPRGNARGRMLGVVLGLAALGLLGAQLDWLGSWASQSLFAILAATTVISAVGAVTLRSPVYCAIWFALTLMGTAGLMLLGGAQFLGVATIVVYAGAILVTFLFVLMLAQPEGHAFYDRVSWEALLSSCAGALLVGMLTLTAASVYRDGAQRVGWTSGPANEVALDELAVDAQGQPPADDAGDNVPAIFATGVTSEQRQADILNPRQMERLGKHLFSEYLVAVEVAGVLLLVALVGATAIVSQHKRPADRLVGGGRHG